MTAWKQAWSKAHASHPDGHGSLPSPSGRPAQLLAATGVVAALVRCCRNNVAMAGHLVVKRDQDRIHGRRDRRVAR